MIAGGMPTKDRIAAPSPIVTPRDERGASSGKRATIQRAIAAPPADKIQANEFADTIHTSASPLYTFRVGFTVVCGLLTGRSGPAEGGDGDGGSANGSSGAGRNASDGYVLVISY
jgi:hypothetical protein